MFASIILIVLLCFSLFINFTQFVGSLLTFDGVGGGNFSSSRDARPKLDEFLVEEGIGHDKIAVISVDGVIASSSIRRGSMVEVIKVQLDRAAEDKRVKAVVLKVDSPGGEVLASDDIYKAIVEFQNVTRKPVVCSMGTLAASGGYYISSGCRWIVANELTLTGSIGVIMHGWNYRGLMDKVGVAPMTFKSGRFKDMLSSERKPEEIPAEERDMVQKLIDETYGKFKDVVSKGRSAASRLNKSEGKPLEAGWADYADGRIMSGTQAFEHGFVDELGDFDTAVERAERIAGITHPSIIEYRERHDLSSLLSLFGESAKAKDIKIDLGIEIPGLRSGCLYFLSPVLLH